MSCLPYARHFDIRRSDVTLEIRVIGNNTCAAEGAEEGAKMMDERRGDERKRLQKMYGKK